VLGAYCDTNLDSAGLDLCGDILNSLESGRAEAVDAASSSGGREASGKAGGADVVCGLGVGDLVVVSHCSEGVPAMWQLLSYIS